MVNDSLAMPLVANHPKSGIISDDVDSFYDPHANYSKFPGRVTDISDSKKILKIISETGNVKFFRSGDEVEFRVASMRTEPCIGFVREIEKNYFVLYVQNLRRCWKKDEYFRRGTQLVLYSKTLDKRVREGSKYRQTLLQKKKDFLEQLNNINHFLWSYDQERIKVSIHYDKQVGKIKELRQTALDKLLSLKGDNLVLRKELIKKLDDIDSHLKFYQVERQEMITDRWHLDHDLGLPVSRRPMELK